MAEQAKQFGDILRQYRNQTRDPKNGRSLTQQRFTDLLYEKTGIQYSYGTMSEWERNKSNINKDDRATLVALAWILFEYGGIQERMDGDYLLEIGNYRALSVEECQQITPKWALQFQDEPPEPEHDDSLQIIVSVLVTYFVQPQQMIRTLAANNDDGLPPDPITDLLGNFGNWLRGRGLLTQLAQMLLWLLMATAVIWTTFPLMNNQQHVQYAIGATMIPLITAVIVWQSTRKAWHLNSAKSDGQRFLFILTGALAGFHASYMTTFMLALFLNIPLPNISITLQLLPAFLFIMPATWYAAVQMPRRVWRAFHTFPFTASDGIIMSILFIFPCIWGFLFTQAAPFLQQYPLLTQIFIFALGFTVFLWLKKQGEGRIILRNMLVGVIGLVWLLFILPEGNLWVINGLITAVIWLIFARLTNNLSVDLLGAFCFLLAIGLSAAMYTWVNDTIGLIVLSGGTAVYFLFPRLRSHLQIHWSLIAITVIWVVGFEVDMATNYPTIEIITAVSALSILLLARILWKDRQA